MRCRHKQEHLHVFPVDADVDPFGDSGKAALDQDDARACSKLPE
jgi:hypothetical protein